MSEQRRRPGRYPDEVRERAVRMVFDHQAEYPSQWKAIWSIAEKLSVIRETLRQWVRRAETDAGQRPGLTSDERLRMRELEREVKELRRANEILKSGGGFLRGGDIPPGVESSGEVGAVAPGGVFVVEGAVGEAAVDDPDEPVRQGPERPVVAVASARRWS